ncbi:glycosyltransferase [Vibrio sp. JZG10]
MNIGIVTTWFERGAAYVSRQYKQSLEEQGAQVFIYARGGESYAKEDSNWNGSEVYWQQNNSIPYKLYVNLDEFKAWVKSNNIETVIFNEQSWFEPVLFCKNEGIKVGAYVDYYTQSMIPCFDAYDFLLCNTKKHLEAFKNHKNPIYIPWGTDTKTFDCSKTREHSPNLRFFHSCGMNPYRKGTDLLVESFLNMDQEHVSRSELIIHTQFTKEDFKKYIPDYCYDQFEIAINKKTIRLIDKTVTAPGLYHLGDVYVYPSRLDGLGLTVAEAISCGMAIVVPDDGPMNEFVGSDLDRTIRVQKLFCRDDGYYWPQNEVEIADLTKALVEIIDNGDLYKDNTETIRKRALQTIDWKKNSSKLLNAIADVNKSPLTHEAEINCISYNNKKLPYCYEFPYLYKFAYWLYKKVIKR